MIKSNQLWLCIGLALSTFPTFADEEHIEAEPPLEEVQVWGDSLKSSDAGYTNPSSVLLPKDMTAINAATTEDLVKFEPSLVIRRRFIGDSNGTLGIRGSNMFQTSRSMVFADGVPLHYLLQTRWSGAPRWTMVSASEIEKVEVLYGPFSAEYSGNSMGGTVLIETGIPQKQELHANISAFSQQFSAYGFDDSIGGYKGFASYGDKVGNWSYYLSFNRLDSDSQPQTFAGAGVANPATGDMEVTGGIDGLDARGREQLWYGDTGIVNSTTNNYKIKIGYDFGQWQSLLNVAFEDRVSANTGNSYIKDSNGNTVWNGDALVDSGNGFSFDSKSLNDNILNRESVSLGLRVKGEVSDKTQVQINLNQFDILKDQSRASITNPNDPSFTLAGQINEFENSGWTTAEVKFVSDDVLVNGLQVVSGLRHEDYELNLNQYDSSNYRSNNSEKDNVTSRFGGKTRINAAFVQTNWGLSTSVDLALGLRYEQFESADGYYSKSSTNPVGVDIVNVPSVNASKASPKFSIGYTPKNDWLVRYSIASAYRFPVVEELFRQYESYNNINESNPELKPESGLHHNMMIEKSLSDGYIRVNFFHEVIKDAIESQSTTTANNVSINTFVPIDKTRASGAELIINQYNIFKQFDLRFNAAYTDAEIEKNTANPGWEGNISPRMPKWRANILATYHFSEKWDVGLNTQYASNSFGRLQNDDTIVGVYGAQDAYTRIGLKTNHVLSDHLRASLGIDNLTNEIAYVAHPWPGRTAYLSLAYKL